MDALTLITVMLASSSASAPVTKATTLAAPANNANNSV